MSLRPKYSLKLFLLFATAMTVFLGYSQIRRQKILEVCDNLRADGYVFAAPNALFDKVVWQRKPIVGHIILSDSKAYILFSSKAPKGRLAARLFLVDNNAEVAQLETLGVVAYGTRGLHKADVAALTRIRLIE